MAPQRNENRPKVRLTLEGFRVLRRGEPGYSPTARKYINETSGEIISVRRYQKLASRVPVEPQSSRSSSITVRPSPPTTPTPSPTTPTTRVARPEPQSFGVEINKEEKYYAVMRDLERGVSLSRSLKFHHISKKSFFDELSIHENAEAIVDTRFRNKPVRYHTELLRPINTKTITITRGNRTGQTYERVERYQVFPEPLPTFTIVQQNDGIVQISVDRKYAGTVGVYGNWLAEVLHSKEHVPLPPGFNPVVRTARGDVVILETDEQRLRKLFNAMTEAERLEFSANFYKLMLLGMM